MLRNTSRRWRLEQWPSLCLTVTVDLVGGNSPWSATGATRPTRVLGEYQAEYYPCRIVRHGQALSDGGLWWPPRRGELRDRGERTGEDGAGVLPDTPDRRLRTNERVQTLLRSPSGCQNHSLNVALGVKPADVVIEPDVTGFDLTALPYAKEWPRSGKRRSSRTDYERSSNAYRRDRTCSSVRRRQFERDGPRRSSRPRVRP